MALKKSDMIDLLNDKIGISKAEAKDLVDEFFETLICVLESGESIRIQQFGVFELLDKSERVGRNPKSGHIHIISARRVVSFRASHLLRKRVQSFGHEKPLNHQQLDEEVIEGYENTFNASF